MVLDSGWDGVFGSSLHFFQFGDWSDIPKRHICFDCEGSNCADGQRDVHTHRQACILVFDYLRAIHQPPPTRSLASKQSPYLYSPLLFSEGSGEEKAALARGGYTLTRLPVLPRPCFALTVATDYWWDGVFGSSHDSYHEGHYWGVPDSPKRYVCISCEDNNCAEGQCHPVRWFPEGEYVRAMHVIFLVVSGVVLCLFCLLTPLGTVVRTRLAILPP